MEPEADRRIRKKTQVGLYFKSHRKHKSRAKLKCGRETKMLFDKQ